MCNIYCFPRQQWLRERASISRSCTHCLSCIILPFCLGKASSFCSFNTLSLYITWLSNTTFIEYNIYHRHNHQGLDPLIRSVSKVTTALPNVSLVFQLFSFIVVCSDMISKGFGFVAFFASVETSFVCIHLSCLVCCNLQFPAYVVFRLVVIKGVACQRSQ